MTTAAAIGLLRGLGPALFILVAAMASVAIIIISLPFPYDAAERRLCDQAVANLLHSKDLVEVQRAGIIIREVNCGIGRRLKDLQ